MCFKFQAIIKVHLTFLLHFGFHENKGPKKKKEKVLTKILHLIMSSSISNLLKAEIKLEIEKSRIKLEKEITQSK